MTRLKGKTAIVVGAGSVGAGVGNGRAIAIMLARHGASVAAVDLSLQAAEHTRASIEEEGGTSIALHADASVASEMSDAVERTLAAFGKIDILVNNVGIVRLGGPVELDETDWDQVFQINVKSAFLACKYVLPHMLRQRSGSVIHVSSLASVRSPSTPYCAYTASKAAINGFSHSIAMQYADSGIRSNTILLGMMDTPLVREQLGSTDPNGIDALIAARHGACPTGAMGSPWDAASAALFLASDESSYLTGSEMVVDGGLHRTIGSYPARNAGTARPEAQ